MSGLEDELEKKGKQEAKEEVDSEIGGLSSTKKEDGIEGGGSNQAQDQSADDQSQSNS